MIGSCLKACCLALLAVACVGSGGAATDAKALTPAVVTKEGVKALIIPPPLASLIKKEYPEYRIPTREDMTGAWAGGAHGAFPFAAWGDFDGNRRVDIALILLGDGDWELVVFHQGEHGVYRSFPLLSLPNPGADGSDVQTWILAVMPKGAERNKEHYDEDEGNGEVTVVGKYKFPVDVVELVHLDAEDHLYHWTGEKYEDIAFGYE